MKVQTKIALIFTALCMFILVALSLMVYYFANERAFQDFYVRLQLRAVIAGENRFSENSLNHSAYETVRTQHLQKLPEEREYIVPMDSLRYLIQNVMGGKLPEQFVTDLKLTGAANHRRGYQFVRAITWKEAQREYVIMLTATHSFAKEFIYDLKVALLVANILALLVIFTLGVLFSNQILAPIRQITQNVKKISATSLDKRLETPGGTDEISELSDTFNNMLARLETSFETQNNFVSNASHELNTPITVIMGESEYALSKSPDAASREAFERIQHQAERLRIITQSLLELAQSGFTSSLAVEPVKLGDLMHQVMRVVKGIHPECEIQADIPESPIWTEGNFNLLEVCISNVLNNACKYSHRKPVRFILTRHDAEVFVIVRDQGIGIPKGDLPHVFDPFFRASNVKERKGYGIGLPLAQNIAKLHKGSVDVRSREGEGTEVIIKLPLRS